MNLIEESFQVKEEKKNKTPKIIIILIVLLIIIIIGIVAALMALKEEPITALVDGKANPGVVDILRFEDNGEIYVPLKYFAEYVGYSWYNGDYLEKSESTNKCYVSCEDEVANVSLNSNKILKLNLKDKSTEYTTYEMKNQVKAVNGDLYVSSDAVQTIFNTYFNYDAKKRQVVIATMPYLIQSYSPMVLDAGYEEINSEFENQKSVLKDKLIVAKEGLIGVLTINADGTLKSNIDIKYETLMYQELTGNYLVSNNKKFGLLSSDGKTKIEIKYDELKLIGDDNDGKIRLYLVRKDGKYGVVDENGKEIINIEYDTIGIDKNNFPNNGLTSDYILVDKVIPAKRGEYWKLFNKKGKELVDEKNIINIMELGDSSTSSNKDALPLLVIGEGYDVIVAKASNEKYTLIQASTGKLLCAATTDDIYMLRENGIYNYYINFNNQKINALDFLESLSIKTDTEDTSSNNTSSNSSSNNTSNNISKNNTTSNNSSEEDNNDNDNQGNQDEEVSEE